MNGAPGSHSSSKMGFYPVSFLDPVKDVAKKMFGWDGQMTPDARIMLDGICRSGMKISEGYWRDLTLVRIPKTETKLVFDDVWFDNEAKWIVANGGFVVRVTKDGYPSPVMTCDTIDIPNDKSLTEFKRMIVLHVSKALM